MRWMILLIPVWIFAKGATVEQLFSVQSVAVKKVVTSHSKKSYGYVTVDEEAVYDITPRFDGYVEILYAKSTYKYIKKGEALATVYSPQVYKAKEEFLSSLRYQKTNHRNGMLNSAREKLILLGVSNKEIEEIVKKGQVRKLTTIYASTSGYIFKKSVNQGSYFSKGKLLFEIVNLDNVWVEAKIFEQDLKWLDRAYSFDVKSRALTQTFKGKNPFLYPKSSPKEATYTLRLDVENNSHKLIPGMYVSVIMKDKPFSYLTLPSSAVIRKGGRYYVFLVTEFKGEYEPKEVKVEVLNSDTYIIKQGLSEGERVVNNAMFMQDSDAQINALY